MAKNLLWVDDDCTRVLLPLERALERDSSLIVHKARSYLMAMEKLTELQTSANRRIDVILLDIIIPHGEDGALAKDLGLTLAERAIRLGVMKVGFLTVVGLQEVYEDYQTLERKFKAVAFGYFPKTTLLEPGRLEKMREFLAS